MTNPLEGLTRVQIAFGVATTQTEVEPDRRWDAIKLVSEYLGKLRLSLASAQAAWKPFWPRDWALSKSCYPCVLIAPDGEISAPCDPWTLPPENDWLNWLCVALPGDYVERFHVAPAQGKEELWACTGCGSQKSMEQIHGMGCISCCPERKMAPSVPSAHRGGEK